MLLAKFLPKIWCKKTIFWPKEAVSAEKSVLAEISVRPKFQLFPGALFRFSVFWPKISFLLPTSLYVFRMQGRFLPGPIRTIYAELALGCVNLHPWQPGHGITKPKACLFLHPFFKAIPSYKVNVNFLYTKPWTNVILAFQHLRHRTVQGGMAHLQANLGWVNLDLGSSPGCWPLL